MSSGGWYPREPPLLCASNVVCLSLFCRGVFDMGGLSDAGDVMRTEKHRVVARVLANPPQGSREKVEQYYERICPQLLELVSIEDGQADEESLEMRAVACECVRAVSERSLIQARRNVFDVAMAPLLALCDDDDDGDASKDLCGEDELSHCVFLLHVLFVTSAGDPSSVFSSHLEPAVPALLALHCAVCFGASHLRRPVKELLARYLRTCGHSDAVAALRFFAFQGCPDMVAPAGGEGAEELRGRRFRLVRQGVRFAPGGGGGVEARWSDEAEENFYVSDDEKSIAIVDLLDGCSKEVGVELFMSLLQDLSRLMSKKGAVDPGNVEGQLEEATGAESDRSVEEKLLALNDELDRTMLDLRRQLMVIRLLGLLSEDDQLQERLAKDSDRLLVFVGLTLERAAITCRQKQLPTDPKEEQDLDEGPSMLESQSLMTALTLLSLKATQPRAKVGREEWQRMSSFLDDLRVLSKSYPEERARGLAGKMANLIATHGVFSSAQVDLVGGTPVNSLLKGNFFS